MQRAFQLAAQAAGVVNPRPPVGAVIVKDGEIVGEGHTTPSPGPHAETRALEQAGDAARGATAYVTLEPCGHSSATPPCVDALSAAGVARVVSAVRDPNPDVDGSGIARLHAMGVSVDEEVTPSDRLEAWGLIEGFARHLATRRPLVIAKYAMSLDGKIATRTGDSHWITSEVAREEVHRQRARVDAIMIGSGTAIADDPRLTARPGGDRTPEPRPGLRIVVDTIGRLPPSARLLWEPGSVLMVYGVRSEDAGPLIGLPDNVEKMELPAGYGGIDLVMLLDELGARGITSVVVEGGSRLLGSLFDLDLIDKVYAYIAPTIVGGDVAPGPVAGSGVEKMAAAYQLEYASTRQLGPDTLVTGYLPGHTGHIPHGLPIR
jgi:diaminohydroxyphosphoribosylaminopyrimidine deaminase/5-amino-6-(5-phosphoribosylamino)uracil reductase